MLFLIREVSFGTFLLKPVKSTSNVKAPMANPTVQPGSVAVGDEAAVCEVGNSSAQTAVNFRSTCVKLGILPHDGEPEVKRCGKLDLV